MENTMKKSACKWILGIVATMIAGLLLHIITKESPFPSPGFVNPSNGDHVSHQLQTEGVITKPLDTRVLRFCVREKTGTNYGWWHPQDDTTKWKHGGRMWEAVVFVGPAGSAPVSQQYEISAIAVTRNTSNTFDEYLQEAKKKGKWTGIERLPSGEANHILATVIVTRE